MSSIDELEAAHKAAMIDLRDAQNRLRDAEKELQMAHLDATGLRGHLVSNERGVKFVVEKQGWWKGRVAGSIVKKDGTLGQRSVECAADKVTDHGSYEAPTK